MTADRLMIGEFIETAARRLHHCRVLAIACIAPQSVQGFRHV